MANDATRPQVRGSHDHPTGPRDLRPLQGAPARDRLRDLYRTLNLLVEHGEVLKLRLGDGVNAERVSRDDANTDPHEHIRCTRCGAIADLRISLPLATTLQAARETGFDIDGYALRFLGRCADCR